MVLLIPLLVAAVTALIIRYIQASHNTELKNSCMALIKYNQCRILSPLKAIPGPFLASLTGFWLVFIDLGGKRTTTIHKLHQKYGQTVRIGPNEVSFSDPSAFSQIYAQQTVFMKAPAYNHMSVKPLGIFALQDKAAHAQRRSLLSHAFSQQSLENCLPLIREKIDLLLRTVERNKGKPLDMFLRFRLLALDIVGELFLGQSFGALEADETPQFLHDGDRTFLQLGIAGNLPWIDALLRIMPVSKIQEFLGSSERIAQVRVCTKLLVKSLTDHSSETRPIKTT